MNLTDLSTRHWPSVAVAVALVGLFGLISIAKLPIQLLPTIEQPQVSIANFWRAAAPEEMESSIVEPQENVLRNTPGVTDINAFISRGSGFVTLTFDVGTDIQEAKLDVINNLNHARAPAPVPNNFAKASCPKVGEITEKKFADAARNSPAAEETAHALAANAAADAKLKEWIKQKVLPGVGQ